MVSVTGMLAQAVEEHDVPVQKLLPILEEVDSAEPVGPAAVAA